MQDVESQHWIAKKFIKKREETAKARTIRVTDWCEKAATTFGTFLTNVEKEIAFLTTRKDIFMGQERGGCPQVLPYQKV